ncbi:Holliday junction resolvase RuvX [Spelaeicoccus albus]|uniref:Putative pre-16S rRNA nuclease n=1 Tax=Spelaeicoccus albus TaxID=1280376 RepID=A0A7Z0D4B4_9MICO|nr:Holliday junction resolvase RuvX [Spelaeicoccus albus]NYI68621.1 putative Holliday junction resolvase [Spelaeicoccus albus]
MFRRGTRIGVDVGAVRVGLAACDPDGILATPIETIPRDVDGGADVVRIAAEASERGVIEIIVGLPRSLDGVGRQAAATASEFAGALAGHVAPIPVRLVDERLTTVAAHRQLRDSGMAGKKQRGVVDTVAAVLILQQAIDSEKATGRPPGAPAEPPGTGRTTANP